MKVLLSVNNKFFEKNSFELIDYIESKDERKIIDGFELFINIENEYEKNYLFSFATICKNKNYIFQFHGDSSLSIENQKLYLDKIDELSKIIDKKINIVLHPITSVTFEEELKKTNEYFSIILNYIYMNNYNLSVSIENLNSTAKFFRLSKDYLTPILYNNMDLNFTYNVGHELIEYGKTTDLTEILKNRLINVHIHTFLNTMDHMFINDENINKEKWVKALNYLKLIKYDNTLVLEYSIDYMGNNLDEKLDNYLKCANFIEEYL